MPKDDFYYPVRFVESGRFLQQVALEGLEFADSAGSRLEAKGWLEIALWPDRAVLSFGLETTNAWPEGALEFVAGERRASAPLSTRQPGGAGVVWPEESPAPSGRELRRTATEARRRDGLHGAEAPHEKWTNTRGTYYPEEELDRLDRWRFTVRNDSEREATLPIMFVDDQPAGYHRVYSAALRRGWHADRHPGSNLQELACAAEKGVLRHQGPWFHGCTFVRLPPHSQRVFSFTLTYARYGGVPAASHAQLSLIGWGHNQFWEQAAIGSFGESICYEPGRVQRRCCIDDIAR